MPKPGSEIEVEEDRDPNSLNKHLQVSSLKYHYLYNSCKN